VTRCIGQSVKEISAPLCFMVHAKNQRTSPPQVTSVPSKEDFYLCVITAGTDPDDRRRGDYGDLDGSIFGFLQQGQILRIGGAVTTVTWTDL
jgi:hypothetical protein